MKEIITNELIKNNYMILNGKIVDIVTNIVDDNNFTFNLLLQGDNWQCAYGSFNLFDEKFDSKRALVDLSTVLEETNLIKVIGKNVRIAVKDISEPVEFIGNIIYDRWYNFNNYYINTVEEQPIKKKEDENDENNVELKEIKEDEV